MKYFKIQILLFLLFFVSCGTMEKNDRISRRADFINRFSSKELIAEVGWKMGSDILVLRKNKTFRIYSNVLGIANSGYYCGTYKFENDTLKLFYHNNHKLDYDKFHFTKIDTTEILKAINKTFYVTRNRTSW